MSTIPAFLLALWTFFFYFSWATFSWLGFFESKGRGSVGVSCSGVDSFSLAKLSWVYLVL